jgi:hypothetical protein
MQTRRSEHLRELWGGCRRAGERRPLLQSAPSLWYVNGMGLELPYLSCAGEQPTIGYPTLAMND